MRHASRCECDVKEYPTFCWYSHGLVLAPRSLAVIKAALTMSTLSWKDNTDILCTLVHRVSSHLVSPVQASSPGGRKPLELAKVAEVDGEVRCEDGVLDHPKGLGILGRTEGV